MARPCAQLHCSWASMQGGDGDMAGILERLCTDGVSNMALPPSLLNATGGPPDTRLRCTPPSPPPPSLPLPPSLPPLPLPLGKRCGCAAVELHMANSAQKVVKVMTPSSSQAVHCFTISLTVVRVAAAADEASPSLPGVSARHVRRVCACLGAARSRRRGAVRRAARHRCCIGRWWGHPSGGPAWAPPRRGPPLQLPSAAWARARPLVRRCLTSPRLTGHCAASIPVFHTEPGSSFFLRRTLVTLPSLQLHRWRV